MSFEDAIKPSNDGAIIDVEVSPGAAHTKVPDGYNQWRKRIGAKIRAQPENGQANHELVKELAKFLNVPTVRISITSGALDSRKSIKVRGMSRDDVIKTLRGKV